MYTEKDLILHAKKYIDELLNGLNPLSGEKLAEKDIVKHKRIFICFQYVSKWLKYIADEYEKEEYLTKQNETSSINKSQLYSEIELILHAKNYMDKLSKGVSPVSGLKISDCDIVKNEMIVICFQYISKWLKMLARELEIEEQEAIKKAIEQMEKLQEEKLTKNDLNILIDKEERFVLDNRSCEDCKYYVNNSCGGFGPVCEDYEGVKIFTHEEVANWPTMGDATYYKTHKKSRN